MENALTLKYSLRLPCMYNIISLLYNLPKVAKKRKRGKERKKRMDRPKPSNREYYSMFALKLTRNNLRWIPCVHSACSGPSFLSFFPFFSFPFFSFSFFLSFFLQFLSFPLPSFLFITLLLSRYIIYIAVAAQPFGNTDMGSTTKRTSR